MFPVSHRPIVSNGIRYSLHHLQPFSLKPEGHGRDGGDIAVRVPYHSHVYSIADNVDASAHWFIDEAAKWRTFCQFRHANSLMLPQSCSDMVNLNFPSWLSQDRNRRNNMAVTDADATTGFRYVIMYSLMPGKATGIDAELVVKSAYEKEVGSLQKLKKSGVRQLIKTCYFNGVNVPK